jgi:hypothetical protein
MMIEYSFAVCMGQLDGVSNIRVEHSRQNRPIVTPQSKPKSVVLVYAFLVGAIRNETEFRNLALIASTSGVEIRPSGV